MIRSLLLLANYWKSLCTIDINNWSKWLHVHKIPLILKQDDPLPTNLFHPTVTGRYSTIQCRVAASKLFAMLRSWSTFVLLENHSYIKLFPDPTSPQYFCLVRVIQMQSCVLVHVGFPEGTSPSYQREHVSLIKTLLSDLKISLPNYQTSVVSKKRNLSYQSCAHIMEKQLQKAMIRYDHQSFGSDTAPVQFYYMEHYRWQWKVQKSNPLLLNALLQCRLKEGFLIASTYNGIVTLATEIQVKVLYIV